MFANIERIFIDQKMQKNAAKSAFDTLDEETKASMLSGGDEIEKTLNEIETNNLKKKQNEKIPQLYTKNSKGRYQEYKIPDLDISKTFYRKINGKI